MVGGAGSAGHGGREQRLAVCANGRHKGALRKHVQHGPCFGGGCSIAAGRWPFQAISKDFLFSMTLQYFWFAAYEISVKARLLNDDAQLTFGAGNAYVQCV